MLYDVTLDLTWPLTQAGPNLSSIYFPTLINATRLCFDCCTWDHLKIHSWYIFFISTSITHSATLRGSLYTRRGRPSENIKNTLESRSCESTGFVCLMTRHNSDILLSSLEVELDHLFYTINKRLFETHCYNSYFSGPRVNMRFGSLPNLNFSPFIGYVSMIFTPKQHLIYVFSFIKFFIFHQFFPRCSLAFKNHSYCFGIKILPMQKILSTHCLFKKVYGMGGVCVCVWAGRKGAEIWNS